MAKKFCLKYENGLSKTILGHLCKPSNNPNIYRELIKLEDNSDLFIDRFTSEWKHNVVLIIPGVTSNSDSAYIVRLINQLKFCQNTTPVVKNWRGYESIIYPTKNNHQVQTKKLVIPETWVGPQSSSDITKCLEYINSKYSSSYNLKIVAYSTGGCAISYYLNHNIYPKMKKK